MRSQSAPGLHDHWCVLPRCPLQHALFPVQQLPLSRRQAGDTGQHAEMPAVPIAGMNIKVCFCTSDDRRDA